MTHEDDTQPRSAHEALSPWRFEVFATAVHFLTRLTIPGVRHDVSPETLRASRLWYPLVGALMGGITALAAMAGGMLWNPWLAVIAALALEARLTGAMHEDAAADLCDAAGGGMTVERRLDILKDSRIGSYGALGLLLAVLLRAGAMTELFDSPLFLPGVIMSATLGRLAMIALMGVMRPAPGRAGLASSVGEGMNRREWRMVMLLAAPGLLILGVLSPLRLLAAFALGAVFLALYRRKLLRWFGGYTGDCLGAACYVVQVLALLVIAAG